MALELVLVLAERFAWAPITLIAAAELVAVASISAEASDVLLAVALTSPAVNAVEDASLTVVLSAIARVPAAPVVALASKVPDSSVVVVGMFDIPADEPDTSQCIVV